MLLWQSLASSCLFQCLSPSSHNLLLLFLSPEGSHHVGRRAYPSPRNSTNTSHKSSTSHKQVLGLGLKHVLRYHDGLFAWNSLLISTGSSLACPLLLAMSRTTPLMTSFGSYHLRSHGSLASIHSCPDFSTLSNVTRHSLWQ